ncbi:MAG: HEAT repeat domain-containing protein [Betaproteobacteria bacterium]
MAGVEDSGTATPLAPEQAARLVEFARACKAAARAVVLYPGGHPAVAATLGRIVEMTSEARMPRPMRLTVLPDQLLLEGRAAARGDPALGELAALLHHHLVGELTIHPGGLAEAWQQLLLLLARSPDSVRAEGGISRLWATMAGRHVELREIDYAEVLRERAGGLPPAWDHIVSNCLQGQTPLSPDVREVLVEAAADPEKLVDLVAALQSRGAETGASIEVSAAAILHLLHAVVTVARERRPDGIEPVLRNMAGAIGRLTPEMLMAMLARRGQATADGALVDDVVSHMSDGTIARFIARSVADGTATDRLAQAFQALVLDGQERVRLLALARSEAASSPLGSDEGFDGFWDQVAQKLLTEYTDRPFVSESYARELSLARDQAVPVEQVGDDPEERVRAWLNTIATSALRALDVTLVLDLLRLEQDAKHWADLMTPIAGLIEDLLLVGDFEAAGSLLAVLTHAASPQGSKERRQAAAGALERLVEGAMLRHVSAHLPTIDDAQFERAKAMCVSIGEPLVRPLAEALSVEEHGRTRERLTEILLGFDALGRRTVERLKSSPNPAVRRTAIHLLRAFGGNEALPEIARLLDDTEPQVQRAAVRALLEIGTDRAYQVLEQALADGTAASRDAIMQSLTAVRDERATPLFVYILEHVDHRGPLASIYLRAIEALGALRDGEAVPALKHALYRGEWWAPRRTAALRHAAASALARIGTPDAASILDEAAQSGSRGVRAAARAQAQARSRPAPARPAGETDQ